MSNPNGYDKLPTDIRRLADSVFYLRDPYDRTFQQVVRTVGRLRKTTCNDTHKLLQIVLAKYLAETGFDDVQIESSAGAIGNFDVVAPKRWGIEVSSQPPSKVDMRRKIRGYSPHVRRFSFAYAVQNGDYPVEGVLKQARVVIGDLCHKELYHIDSILTVVAEPPFTVTQHDCL
ncbi:MAG: hypothetical protein HYW23_02090 [Candidatus Aenigmarchaeota archaeon]|nr:hypothetical protein [Candidatus Aenigmarchaeota archaeon]